MRVQVNLSDDMVKKIDGYAKQLGVSRSALCSMFIGQACLSYDKAYDAFSGVTDSFKENLENVILNSPKK